jgi:serine protease Do
VPAPAAGQLPATEAVRAVLPKMVKIYGAGGIRGLEPYQSGFLISPDGHILTAFSYVLDASDIVVLLHDGSRHSAQLVGLDPRTEIAVLKVDAQDQAYFDLQHTVQLAPGDQILAFSNLYGIATYDEPVSVLHGYVSAIWQLSARRGAFKTPYDGTVYVVDAMTNNAGAAGGALTDARGQLAGLLGKELRNAQTNTWLNYAIPIEAIRATVQAILAGTHHVPASEDTAASAAADPWTIDELGLQLVPDVLQRTPPYVEQVRAGSAAARSGILPDDLIVYVASTVTRSQKEFLTELAQADRADPLTLVVLRDHQLHTITIETDHE